MARGTPDWVRMVQVAVTVETVPIVPEPATEVVAAGIGRYSGTDQTYQVVKSWTVATDKTGELKEISITSSVLGKTHWKITIGAVAIIEDILIDAPLTIPYHDLKLAEETVVTVSCKSTDGSSINADASIVAKEIG